MHDGIHTSCHLPSVNLDHSKYVFTAGSLGQERKPELWISSLYEKFDVCNEIQSVAVIALWTVAIHHPARLLDLLIILLL